jgi:outer membrane protein TolC
MALALRRSLDVGMGSSRPAAAALAVLVLSACSTPALQAPSPSVPLAATISNETPAAAATSALDDDWWDGFGDATLARLVKDALSANQDVAMALQRVGQARGSRRASLPAVAHGGRAGCRIAQPKRGA